MVRLWLFLHLLGFTMWLGGSIGAMFAAIAAKVETRQGLGAMVRAQASVQRLIIGPGALITVLSGLMLTLNVSSRFGESQGVGPWLMVMQVAGLAAGLLTLFVIIPDRGAAGPAGSGDPRRRVRSAPEADAARGHDLGDPRADCAAGRGAALGAPLPPSPASSRPRLPRSARRPHRANAAARLPRRADQRAQLHDALVEGPRGRSALGQQRRRGFPYRRSEPEAPARGWKARRITRATLVSTAAARRS